MMRMVFHIGIKVKMKKNSIDVEDIEPDYSFHVEYSTMPVEAFISFDTESKAKSLAAIIDEFGLFRSTSGIFTLRVESLYDGVPKFFLKLFGGNYKVTREGVHKWYSMSQDVQSIMRFVYKYLDSTTKEEFSKKYNTCKNTIYPKIKID